MPANAALTATELARLNANQDLSPYYLSFHADTVVATADVATTPSGAYTLQIAVTNTANWTKIREGMTAKITNSAATVLRGYYRIRTGGNAGALNIEQIAFADPGSIANANRVDVIQQGDKISVLERFDLYSMKPLVIGTTIYQDGTILVGTQNVTPEVVVNISFNDGITAARNGDYVTEIASDGGTQHLVISATVVKWPTSSGSTVSYSWVVPSSGWSASGAGSATLTADVSPGDYILYLQVTDSIAGITQEVCRWVRIHSPGDPPIPVNVTQDTEDRQGRKVTVRGVQARLGAIPPGAKCCITGPYTWNGLDVATANHTFIGYLDQQPYIEQPNYFESTATILGVGHMIDKLMGAPATLKYAGTPVTWEEVAPSLSTVQFALWWTLRWRCANALKCFNFTDFSTSGTIARRQNIPIPQGTIFQQLKSLADMYESNVGSRPDGEIIVQQLPSILQDRSGVATRCTLTDSIYSDITVTWQRRVIFGDVFHSGFYISDSSLSADIAVQGEAPGLQTFGQGGKTDKRTNKTYESVVDNEIRVGYWFANLNNEFPDITLTIPHNWDVFVMADLNRVVVNVPASKSPTGSAISITCIPVSFTKKWINGRRATITLKLESETTGVAGENVPIPPQVAPQPTPVNPISALPITPLLPPVPDIGGTVAPPPPVVTPGTLKLALNGDIMAMNTAGSVFITPNFVRKHAPDWNNITPGTLAGTLGTYTPQQVVFDPFGASAGTQIGLYALTVNAAGTSSQVQYTPCAALVAPAWTPGTELADLYTVERVTLAQAGGVLIYGSGGGEVLLHDYDFTVSDGGFTTTTGGAAPHDPFSTWTAGVGWVNTAGAQNGGGDWSRVVQIFLNISPSYIISQAIITFTAAVGAFGHGPATQEVDAAGIGGTPMITQTPTTGSFTLAGTGAFTATQLAISIFADAENSFGALTGSVVVKRLQIYGIVGAGGANVRYSSDYGQTFGGTLVVGGTVGGGGFDVSRNSGVSFAGGFGTVYKATTLGGTYSPYAGFGTNNPTALIVPWYRKGHVDAGGLQTSSTTPDILAGFSSGSIRLAWLTGGASAPAGTFDITPNASFVPNGPNSISCAFGKFISAADQSGTVWLSKNAGTSWTHAPGFTNGGEVRVRRNDTSFLTNRGAYFALDGGGVINYSSHFDTAGSLFGRVMPGAAVSFDPYP